MLELQENQVLQSDNRISCDKGLKAKISCFFLCFLCLTPLRLECSRSRKTASFDVTYAEEIEKSASTGLHEWSENVVNV